MNFQKNIIRHTASIWFHEQNAPLRSKLIFPNFKALQLMRFRRCQKMLGSCQLGCKTYETRLDSASDILVYV